VRPPRDHEWFVRTNHDDVVAASQSIDPGRWREIFDGVMARIAGRFSRVEPRRRVRAFVLGLLADLPRKNCWTIAEHAGEPGPHRMQHLLSQAVWDADALRDDIREIAVEKLGTQEVTLVVDETGDLKKGEHTVGVQRQYTGTAGRIENAQVGVFLTYTTAAGHTLIDRELYLPESWTTDPERRAAAGVPAETVFATKSVLAARMITRVLDSGVTVSWVTGDEVYGNAGKLRTSLEERDVGYVLAVACDHHVSTVAGSHRADALAARLPKRAWHRRSAGQGAKGHRFYDWARITLTAPADASPGWRWLLVRRNRRTGELAFYRCYSPKRVTLTALVCVAGVRWKVEESFQTSKGQTGLDEHQVRTWTSWYRWTTLVLVAHLFLAITTAAERASPAPEGLIPLTLNEIRHLFVRLVIASLTSVEGCLRWSWWRRRHQYRARQAHYQRQADREP
jgi:SRSO17 transposase